ncbi:MAG: hypothetical protein QOG82_394 [Actinomycetota bacterium]|nr:hypothetical protein [Actinomycetota bacterium]
MNTDTTTVQPRTSRPQSRPPRPPARRRLTGWIVAGAGVALVGVVLGLAGGGGSSGSSARRPATEATVTSPTDLDVDQPALLDQASGTSEVDQTADTPDADQPGDEVDQTGDTPDVEEPQPPVEALPATLSVTPDPVHLKTGVYSGSITVANVGDEDMHWEALTKPWVTLSDTTGDLGAHGENVITFTIDESQLDAGSFTFKIKVWGDGGTEYVDVTGAKPITEISI